MGEDTLTLGQIHGHELRMLEYLDHICRENNIEYYLCGGTLIGAVRHKGFIPWDDDVDVYLKRPDYERLIQLINPKSGYRALSIDNDQSYYYSYAKLVDTSTKVLESNKFKINGYGLFVDLFPLDVCPSGSTRRKFFLWHEAFLRKCVMTSIQKYSLHRNIIKRLVVRITHLIGARRFSKRLDKVARKHNNETSTLLADASGALSVDYFLQAKWFNTTADLSFEGLKLKAPIDYAAYLSYSYGDYMKLPPKDERVDHKLTVISAEKGIPKDEN
ncbi:Lipopolysaccharide cholinephosphotransferase LicD1 [Furfurilactobacillus rossiae]|uniref:LicD family protein n=1 Tax=Furfurilactobacillus rossiae TaxID=231049 RepID=UPI0015B8E7A4|nr:LicD family protein [Furfurilactobacillus rossiae]MCF6165366.1 LicD family protein [Furfurilactobacillus rossiae]QLE63726.1 Lipopolysaccharide cholinephosphotransferase LicD1 [Furfurilactobacillus rossiae]